jgi:hypothetical protein
MKLKSRLFSVFILCILVMGTTYSQEDAKTLDASLSLGSDFVSRYIWRGINLGGSSPSIQPYLEFGIASGDHAFAIGAWGAYSLSGTQTGQEADLYVSYSFRDMISISLTDYFFPDETAAKYDYFNYNMDWTKINAGEKAQTGHVMEAGLSFNGTDNIPFSLLFAINIWGADARKFDQVNGNYEAQDGIVMSKYLELGYSTDWNGIDMSLFAGVALDNPDVENGEPAGFYGQESAGLINLGASVSREIAITESYAVPLFASLIFNPEAGNVFMVFGLSF